jgi:hypothetical protein
MKVLKEKLAALPPPAEVPELPPPPPVIIKVALQPPGGATHVDPATVPMGALRTAPTGSGGKGDTDGVPVGVPDGVAPVDRDAVAAGDGDRDAVAAGDGEGVGEHIVM